MLIGIPKHREGVGLCVWVWGGEGGGGKGTRARGLMMRYSAGGWVQGVPALGPSWLLRSRRPRACVMWPNAPFEGGGGGVGSVRVTKGRASREGSILERGRPPGPVHARAAAGPWVARAASGACRPRSERNKRTAATAHCTAHAPCTHFWLAFYVFLADFQGGRDVVAKGLAYNNGGLHSTSSPMSWWL